MQESFRAELEKAKAAVPDPPQPKIKIKMPTAQEVPAGPKKITIHVANNARAPSAESPALTGGSLSSDAAPNGPVPPRPPFTAQLEKARSMSGSAPSPSPSAAAKPEDAVRNEHAAVAPRPISAAPVLAPSVASVSPVHPGGVLIPNGHVPAVVAPPPGPVFDIKYRLPGKGEQSCLSLLFLLLSSSLCDCL